EEPRGREDIRLPLARLIELQRARNRVRGAAAQATLVVHGRTAGAEIDARWQRAERQPTRGEHPVASIGQIGNPSVVFDPRALRCSHDFQIRASGFSGSGVVGARRLSSNCDRRRTIIESPLQKGYSPPPYGS